MRCPKCQYISFDTSDRCRNCGYEFALAVDVAKLDLPIQTGDEAIGPFSDFKLSDLGEPARPGQRASGPAPVDATLASAPISPPRSGAGSVDLPLFRDRTGSDAPLVAPAAVPRAPLSVRRTNPAAGRAAPRVQLEEPELDLEAPPPVQARPEPAAVEAAGDSPAAAPAGQRILAAIIDGMIVGTISVIVLYLTLKVCGLDRAAVSAIPLVPFIAFLLLLAGGYFTLFVAANGQTIGKMAAGLKVISADAAAPRVSLGHALLRAAAYLVSALPAGLGFLPALIGAERRAIHDRLAATRVVKA